MATIILGEPKWRETGDLFFLHPPFKNEKASV
jgi:hypothetical protein